jgi:flagellar M-ring protein FliF
MATEAATLQHPKFVASLKPLLLLVGIAAAVAAGVSVVLWSKGPTYSLLYSNLGEEDQAQIAQVLDASSIPYRLEPGSNSIQVPSERVSEARLKLAGQGLPEGDGGFALMDKQPALGVSQFMEGARYQHALEQELARTIASLRPVEGARVHLAVPRQSAFVRDRRPGSASVFVQLKPGRRLEQEQVQAIINLVASSIPELEANQVTVVDQQGRLLSAPQGTDEFALREQHFDMVRRLEEDYTQRIEALLAPLVGPGRVRAQVVAQVDTSITEEAREQYRPDSQIVRSEALSESTSRDGAGANGGVPGSLTNQPPQPGVALPPGVAAANNAAAPAAPQATGAPGSQGVQTATALAPPAPDNTAKQTTRNYEIDRTLAYTRQPAGRLKRLTVAVLIDNVRTTGKDGKPVDRPLGDQQLARITQLVKDAVGFDEARGDSVNVVNSSFEVDTPAPDGEIEKVPLWEQPLFRDLAKIIAGLLVLLVLVLSVLKPLVRGLIHPARVALAGPSPAAIEPPSGQQAKGGAAAALPAAAAAAAAPLAYEQQLAQARTLVTQDPKRVAQVVRTWVAQDE